MTQSENDTTIETNFDVCVAAVIFFVVGDKQFHTVIVERTLRNKKTNWLLTSLFEMEIRPGEAARFISRVYPELFNL